jgi:hypothetical protein
MDTLISDHAARLVDRLNGMNPKINGELSYRMEGVLLAIGDVVGVLSSNDRKLIATAIVEACKRFGQVEGKTQIPTNRFAIQTLQELASH